MRALSFRLIFLCGSLLLAVVFIAAWRSHPPHQLAPFAQAAVGSDAAKANSTPQYNSRFVSSDLDDFVHSSSVTALPGGDLMAVWFAGSREGAADVQVRSARFDAQSGEWGAEQVLATRESTRDGTGRYIRKLGNPVIALGPDQRLWMFYVSVSVGGWATSAINLMVSDDLGRSWSAPRQLVTSPFFNISTLVRAAPVFHADGSIGLPVYHEFMGKFAEYLYLSADGAVIDKFRISRGKHSLQPTIVPLDERRAVAMLRYAGDTHHKVLASRTEDAGQTWSEPYPLQPSNPNSSLAAVGTDHQGLLVALNDLQDGRFKLSLYGTDAGLSQWRPLVELDQSPDPLGQPFSHEAYKDIIGEGFRASSGARRLPLEQRFLSNLDYRVCKPQGCDFEYEYPYFSRGADGLYHLVYSWNNTFIKHVSFNAAWLAERL
ncbi:Predicted neuraminidase (sialidase) [Pseudomonas sp. NFPP10]|uniref:sialidase family protein n=1 Tax=unclassified Pseudomonas TaxID=196821 RepID=UPI00088012D3|nr:MULTISPECIES: sialidase family protein [unclassified Pseudomonas]SDA34215.1 Predicted neuraminidase (sialidase) [Pseudomonas sp. NFPP12]SEM74825.1 Predicted neuraminidase (sialidase) [Pseudomonas sp. NFPP10]SFK34978.1 Predicted neuraminidase (sialidase) [Pseudomonas sp. NFPP08]SFN70211.1 Predicted neuraminidase (sialidase) [Pseudomonas sp. NFPP05]SFY07975.1 Predicted neuraminidase (sialidase) [Pseudomonas sp. NFPP09]